MKTAISIPDPIYESAEKLADRLGKSRSQLYAQAVSHYIARHKRDGVTKKLDEVYDKEACQPDTLLSDMQIQSLPKEDW